MNNILPETKKAFEDFEKSIKDFDKAMQDLSLTLRAIQQQEIPQIKETIDRIKEIPQFEGTWDALNKLTIIHPQDIADKELEETLSEADMINQRDEDLHRDNLL